MDFGELDGEKTGAEGMVVRSSKVHFSRERKTFWKDTS